MTGVPDGELIFRSAGQVIAGWTSVQVTRGVMQTPSFFTIEATARFPGEMRDVVPLGSPCTIEIGGHVVLTGYLERIVNRGSSGDHSVSFSGRGRLCDIVDCAAIINNSTRQNTAISDLAKQLLAPFDGPIGVELPDGEGDGKLYTFNVNLGEAPYEIVERTARFEGLLSYENAVGNLVLARVGTVKHASGFAEGQNIQEYEVTSSMDERFSEYIPQTMSSDILSRDGSVLVNTAAGATSFDVGVTRYRPRIIVSEQMVSGSFLAEQRALWERNRRRGEAFSAMILCDSWLDSAGTPWTPNMIAPISIPSQGIDQPDWVITSVTYSRDGQGGTTCRVTLMPPEALTVEPAAVNQIQARTLDNSNAPSNSPLGDPNKPADPTTAPNAGRAVPIEGSGIL